MNIEIRKLTPELVDDYVYFFDTTPHATHKDEHENGLLEMLLLAEVYG